MNKCIRFCYDRQHGLCIKREIISERRSSKLYDCSAETKRLCCKGPKKLSNIKYLARKFNTYFEDTYCENATLIRSRSLDKEYDRINKECDAIDDT